MSKTIVLSFEEYKQALEAAKKVDMNKIQKKEQHTIAVGCKGCEGGCAAAICAR